ncbi:MAG: methylenetetrahydrofolate reductase [Clostridiales bacterium]|jgi:methylenetetrahydrofolate reductase (NADPH)|nr:methylenetetrahydrofolate reductase [Clostridiales bacterium]
MRISDIIKEKKSTLSFEIFPPKSDVALDMDYILGKLAALKPDFISVTNSAGGNGAASGTAEIARLIKTKYNTESIMHLVCSDATKADIEAKLATAENYGIDNILALRGDKVNRPDSDFCYAKDLIKIIDGNKFCIGAAAYPEGHIDSPSLDADIEYLKQKVDSGADFLTTQLFFDNSLFFEFLEKIKKRGIDTYVLCGIMPVLSKAQINRMIFMCGVSLPGKMVKILNKYENSTDDLIKASIEYASVQIEELLKHGVDGIHIYTMNKPEIAERIIAGLRTI